MQFRSFRFALVIAAVLALCPLLAYADNPASNSTNPNSSDKSLIAADVIQKVEDTAAALYTDALALPDNFISSTAVMPAGGILRGSDGNLFYLREAAADKAEQHYAFKTLEMFNTYLGTWETLEPLPQWLTYCSAEMFNGNLVVCGVGYDTTALAPTSTEYVFMYSPEKGEWSTLNSIGVPLGASLVYDGHNLLVVGGGAGSLTAGTAAYVYFPDKGLGDQVATLSTPVLNPQLAAHQEQVYVYSYGSSPEDWESSTPAAQHLQVFTDDVSAEAPAKDISSALPAFVPTDETGNIRAQVFGSLVATIDGLAIVGPQTEDHAADTHFMAWDGTSFEPYTLRVSANQMYGTAACVYSSKLFAAGASIQEDNHMAFRATTVTAPAVVDGNNAIWQRGSSSLVVMSYNPDISRFSKKVIVDGMLLTLGDEYAYDMGSTVVELASSYLESLHLGQHEMLTYFDGGGVVVTTYFTTEEKVPTDPAASSTNPDGSGKRPMALAKTSDVTLAIPFVILGIGAIGLGIYLVRRKSRSI